MQAMAELVTGPAWPPRPFVVDLDRLGPLTPADLASLESLDSVSVGVATGLCSGPALAAAFAVDLLVAGAGASFGRPGIWTDLMIRRGKGISGRKVMAYLAMTGRSIDSATALRWGLVNLISDDPADEAQRLADQIAQRSAVAVAAILAQARRGAAADYVRSGVTGTGRRQATDRV
jgi:enoyl-CoA hydratase/carnithine racemase